MSILCVIPVRGGSRGLPGKNIRLLGGHPLVAWTIQAALEAEEDLHVVVSTDSAEIAEVALRYGADVPGLRDKRGIVSDHAAPTATPSVELEFTSGTRRFRLRRSPAPAAARPHAG